MSVGRGGGLTGDLVRGLRDAAITLGQIVADIGRAASDADLARASDKHKIPALARRALVKLWE